MIIYNEKIEIILFIANIILILMSIIQYYSTINPTVGEYVLAEFTANTEYFDGILHEYPYRCMMTYQDATKKKKVVTWNKIVPLNTKMVVRVDDVDVKNNIAQVSIAYLDEKLGKSVPADQVQSKLLESFSGNIILQGLIKSVCVITTLELPDVWTRFVHHIDVLRRQYNQDNEENEEIDLWNYFCTNFDQVDTWLGETGFDATFGDTLKRLYQERTRESVFKLTSKIGVISVNGITHTKTLFDTVLSGIPYKFTMRYDTAPYYIFETLSTDSNVEDHKKVIQDLSGEGMKMTNKVYIKTMFEGKKSMN